MLRESERGEKSQEGRILGVMVDRETKGIRMSIQISNARERRLEGQLELTGERSGLLLLCNLLVLDRGKNERREVTREEVIQVDEYRGTRNVALSALLATRARECR